MSAKESRNEVLSYAFKETGSVSTAQVALSTVQLDQVTAEALTSTGIIIHNVEKGTPALEFRFRSAGDDNDADAILIYGIRTGIEPGSADNTTKRAATGDFYRLLASLATTVGGGVADTLLFVDTIVETAGFGVEAGRANNPIGDEIASYILKLGGYDRLLIVAPTLNNGAMTVDAARVDLR